MCFLLGSSCTLLNHGNDRFIIDQVVHVLTDVKLTDEVWFQLQIKKFRDALAKHTPDRCSLGPTKGLEEKELLALSANRDLSFTYSPLQPAHAPANEDEEFATEAAPESLTLPSLTSKSESSEQRTLTTAVINDVASL